MANCVRKARPIVLVALLGMAAAAHGATITVNTLADELAVNGNCSLREAVQATNSDTAVDACPAGAGPDTITLGPDVYALGLSGAIEDANQTGDLLAQYLMFAGDREAALIEARVAVERFPEVEISHMMLSVVASGLGLHEEAEAAGRRAKELAPDTPLVHTALACALAFGLKWPVLRILVACAAGGLALGLLT